MLEKWRRKAFIPNKLARGALGEFFGTFLLVFIGDCIVAQTILSGKVTQHPTNAWINVNVGWGFAIVFCIMVVGRSSGGHINPAVTVMLWSFGAVNAVTTVVYCVAQTLGAFVGAAAVYAYYIDAINTYHDSLQSNPRKYFPVSPLGNSRGWDWVERLNSQDRLRYMHLTAGIYTSFPQQYLTISGAFVDQIVGTGILCLFIAAIIDKRNEIPAHVHALFFGFVVMMIGCAFGMNVGYPVNPARDFGPRVFASLVYGMDVFTCPHPTYFLTTIIGPLVGGVVGGWLYYFCSGYQIPGGEEVTHNNHGHVSLGVEKDDASVPLTKGENNDASQNA